MGKGSVYCIKMPQVNDFPPDAVRHLQLCFLPQLCLDRIQKKSKWLTHTRLLRSDSRCVKMRHMILRWPGYGCRSTWNHRVIPLKAGIRSVGRALGKACAVDSRHRGNDRDLRPPLANYSSD